MIIYEFYIIFPLIYWIYQYIEGQKLTPIQY